MKTIIAGSRSITELHLVEDAVWNSDFLISEVVSGGARGVDTLALQWANNNRKKFRIFTPDWDGLGKRAGFVRNQEMADYADALIAVWDGESRGTRDMIERAQFKGLKVFIYQI